jgi:DNA-binding transcriptional LysR family regulator
MFVTPILGDFLDDHPHVTARTLFLDRVVNIMNEGQDVAIRTGNLPNPSLTAVRVGTVRRILLGAPVYLEVHGEPQHPTDLRQHSLRPSLGPLGPVMTGCFRRMITPSMFVWNHGSA